MEWLIDQLSSLRTAVGTAEYWMGIVTSFALLFIRHRIKLPKVKVSGGGGGTTRLDDGEQFGHHRISVRNDPYFFGYPINRESLLVASARIYDPASKKYEGHLLRWQGEPDNEPFKTEIDVGDDAGLYICGIYKMRVHIYSGTTLNNIELSETLIEPGQSRKLEIHIFDKLNRRYKIPFRISADERRNHAQKIQVNIRVKTTWADRIRQFRDGFREMLNAFTRPSY